MTTGDRPYGQLNAIRKLSGNPDPADVSDADIAGIILASDARVEAETAKVGGGWFANDPSYPIVQDASNYFAASEVISRYHEDTQKSDLHYQKALDICLSIRESSPGSLILATQQYRTFPLNKNAKIYRSLPGAADSSNSRAVFGDDSDTVSP